MTLKNKQITSKLSGMYQRVFLKHKNSSYVIYCKRHALQYGHIKQLQNMITVLPTDQCQCTKNTTSKLNRTDNASEDSNGKMS